MKRRRLGLSTRAIHGDPKARADWTAVAPPLYQSATFTNPVGSTAEVLYTRYGNNPNQVDIGKKLALLEGADAALFLASGMGATALAHLAVLRPGDHLLASEWIYGGVYRLFREEFGKLGIDVTFVNPTQQRTWKRALRKTTRAVFLETPTNPLLRVIDLEPVATVCKAEGLALIVDSTFASPVNFRPLEHGADLVCESATKYLNGHHDVTAGVVAGGTQAVERARAHLVDTGAVLDPFPAYLLRRGLKTLTLRLERAGENALALAHFLEEQPAVERVFYAGLESYPQHELARQQLDGFGGMLAFEAKGGQAAGEAFMNNLQLCARATSLGGVDTVVSHPASTSHRQFTQEQLAASGISPGLIRVSVGCEDADDLVADFRQALDRT